MGVEINYLTREFAATRIIAPFSYLGLWKAGELLHDKVNNLSDGLQIRIIRPAVLLNEVDILILMDSDLLNGRQYIALIEVKYSNVCVVYWHSVSTSLHSRSICTQTQFDHEALAETTRFLNQQQSVNVTAEARGQVRI